MKTRASMLFAIACCALLAACTQENAREIDWAKSALARNPAFEILATNERTGVFTVRDTTTGTVRELRLENLIAAPLPAKVVAQPAPAPAAPVPQDIAPVTTTEMVAAAAVPSADQTTEGMMLLEGPGYSITRGQQASAPAGNNAGLEGPGYSIARAEGNAASSAPRAEATAANVEVRTDPIICQGDRLMRIDGETLEFTGDAFIAERGCDLYISNARITAGGVGIIARQARVHIVNSTIGGTRGSYEASQGAEIYVARTSLSGVGRRFDTATMNDLGGNSYQLP